MLPLRGLVLIALFVLSATGARAQNLVVNGGFDHNISSWNLAGGGNVFWASQDAHGSPSSGCLMQAPGSASGFSRASQLVDVTPGMAYTISGSLNDQTSRPGASAVLFINWIDGAGQVLSVGSQFASIGKSAWNRGTFPATAPPNAARMEINLNAYGDASSTGFALFDDVVVTIDPPTATFTASPASIAAGQSSTLTWTAANATAVSIDNGVGAKPLNGSGSVSPTTTTTYTLTATGAGGTITKQATITVNPLPLISFSATPAVIGGGESSTLFWTTTNATAVSIDNGIGARSLNGSLQVTPAATTPIP
jgi:hypothetical protein